MTELSSSMLPEEAVIPTQEKVKPGVNLAAKAIPTFIISLLLAGCGSQPINPSTLQLVGSTEMTLRCIEIGSIPLLLLLSGAAMVNYLNSKHSGLR